MLSNMIFFTFQPSSFEYVDETKSVYKKQQLTNEIIRWLWGWGRGQQQLEGGTKLY